MLIHGFMDTESLDCMTVYVKRDLIAIIPTSFCPFASINVVMWYPTCTSVFIPFHCVASQSRSCHCCEHFFAHITGDCLQPPERLPVALPYRLLNSWTSSMSMWVGRPDLFFYLWTDWRSDVHLENQRPVCIAVAQCFLGERLIPCCIWKTKDYALWVARLPGMGA